MFLRPRRPLLGAAMLGGTYMAGRASQRAAYREADEEARIQQLEQAVRRAQRRGIRGRQAEAAGELGETMSIGPVQLLVLGFAGRDFNGEIQAELARLRENDTVRLIDVLFVRKRADGNVERLQHSDLTADEASELGAVAGALIGLGVGGAGGAREGAALGAELAPDAELLPAGIWYVDDVLPNDTAAAVALIEHRWAIGLRDTIRDAGGFQLADAWIHPLDLVAIGLIEAEEAQLVTS
jgi:uncharacterized membrane protein